MTSWRASTCVFAIAVVFVACSSDDDEGSGGKNDAATESGSGGKGGKGGTGGSGGSGGTATGGTGATSGTGATGATGGSGGTAGAGNTGNTGGTPTGGGGVGGAVGGAGGTGGSPTVDGGQPIGSLCVNDQNCNQSTGKTVCCAVPGCVAPCECQLETACPGGTPFLPCQTGADCNKFGGGKVCCEQVTGGTTMRFCTKPNGCSGKVIP